MVALQDLDQELIGLASNKMLPILNRLMEIVVIS